VRTAYTRGFHPKPDVTFAPALSLGVASLDEYLDVRLSGAPGEDELVERLNRVTAGGIRFEGAARLGDDDPRLSAIIDGARYAVALSRPALADLGGLGGFSDRLAEFRSAEHARVRRSIEGIGKIVDVKQFCTLVTLDADEARDAIERAGIVGQLVALLVDVRITPQGSAKISEVVEAVTGSGSFPFKAVRVALLGKGVSPMDLAAHRRDRTKTRPPGPELPLEI
jgi:radical SAM-linked protein